MGESSDAAMEAAPVAAPAPASDAAQLVQCALREDCSAFLAVLEELLKSAGFAGARQELARALNDAGSAGCPCFGVFVLRCLAEPGKRPTGAVEALLADLGPSPEEEALSELPPAAIDALAMMVSDGSGELKAVAKVLQAWKVPGLRPLDAKLSASLEDAVLRRARNGSACAAAALLIAVPELVNEEQAMEVLEAVDDGSHDDVAERLAKALSPALQAHLISRRRNLKRLKSAAKAVKWLGLEADFPTVELEYKTQALQSAVKHQSREAVIGLSMNEPVLREHCVQGLLAMGEAWLSLEMAESWEIRVSEKAKEAALKCRALLESTHLRLPSSLPVVVVNDEALVPQMRSALLAGPALGLDAEWEPAQGSRPSTLQLATLEAAFVVDLLTLGSSQALGDALSEVMESTTVAKVSFEGSKDLRKIAGAYPALGGCGRVANLIDLHEVACQRRAKAEGISKKQASQGLSLASLSQAYLGVPLDKTMQMSNWARRPLSSGQLHYAALDAWVPLAVYQKIQATDDA